MGIDIENSAISGVKILTPARFGDDRGVFMETFRQSEFAGMTFVQDNESVSTHPGTMRGLHFQIGAAAQAKLLRVVRGKVLDVAVDIRRGSPTRGRHVTAILSAENARQLLVPTGFAHGFLTLEPDSIVLYKVTQYYAPDAERGLRWDDEALAIPWRDHFTGEVHATERDRTYPRLAELPDYFDAEGRPL